MSRSATDGQCLSNELTEPEDLDAAEVGGYRPSVRYQLVPQFCGFPTWPEATGSLLNIPSWEARAALKLASNVYAAGRLKDSGRSDPQILLGLSVVAAWRVYDGPKIRLREAAGPAGLLKSLTETWRSEGTSEFIQRRAGMGLRRRFDNAVKRASKTDSKAACELAIADLGRTISKVRRKSDAYVSPTDLFERSTVHVRSPDSAGDADYFRSIVPTESRPHALRRYETFLGPFLPDEVWQLLCGTQAFLRETETKTGRVPLGNGVPSAAALDERTVAALSGKDLRAAVRTVSNLILDVIRFDATGWLRSQKTGLDTDLAVDVASIDAESLCDAVLELILSAVGETDGPPRRL